MVGHGGSSARSYLADPTSPIPSHCASIVVTSTLRVNKIYQLHYTLHSINSLPLQLWVGTVHEWLNGSYSRKYVIWHLNRFTVPGMFQILVPLMNSALVSQSWPHQFFYIKVHVCNKCLNPQIDRPPFAATVTAAVLSTAKPGRPGLPPTGFNSLVLRAAFTEKVKSLHHMGKTTHEFAANLKNPF